MVLGPEQAPLHSTSTNGITTNGITTNGIATNGITTNGITTNGISSNGISSNGISSNGISSNGISSMDPPGSCGIPFWVGLGLTLELADYCFSPLSSFDSWARLRP